MSAIEKQFYVLQTRFFISYLSDISFIIDILT